MTKNKQTVRYKNCGGKLVPNGPYNRTESTTAVSGRGQVNERSDRRTRMLTGNICKFLTEVFRLSNLYLICQSCQLPTVLPVWSWSAGKPEASAMISVEGEHNRNSAVTVRCVQDSSALSLAWEFVDLDKLDCYRKLSWKLCARRYWRNTINIDL